MENQITVDGQTYSLGLEQGQVWVHLPYRVDPHQLSAQLLREGYALAHPPDTPDTQGWGEEFSPNGYYPYYLFTDPKAENRSVFAFYPNPEDAVTEGEAERLALGERSRRTVERWVPVLARLGTPTAGGEKS